MNVVDEHFQKPVFYPYFPWQYIPMENIINLVEPLLRSIRAVVWRDGFIWREICLLHY